MFKGRIFVVDDASLKKTLDECIVSVRTPAPTGEMWEKTIADIMADMLQIKIGDYIFLWKTKDEFHKSQIYGTLRAVSAPYYKMDNDKDNCPFKIKVEKVYDFKNPIDEYDVLNCPYIKEPLWTIIGKKIAGKSRGSTPLSIDEIQYLMTLLLNKNENYTYKPFSKDRVVVDVPNKLHISYTAKGENSPVENLSDLRPNDLCFFNVDGSLKYEKTLETIFNQEMSARNGNFFSFFGIDVNKVIWFSNYLPYSIEQSEMDYLIMESEDGQVVSRYYLVEFMKGTIDKDHIYRCLQYSRWISDTLSLGTLNVCPILVCGRIMQRTQELDNLKKCIELYKQSFKTQELSVYTYDFSRDLPRFEKKILT